MKRLILMRHAKSSWDDDDLPDHDRPLAARGRHDAPRMARRLVKHGERPTLLLSSSAKRALETAEIVRATFELPPQAVRLDAGLYLATPNVILAVVATQDDAHSVLIVFGHNPGFTELVNELIPSLALDNLPTAGVAAIDFAVDRWRDIGQAPGRLAYLDYPKKADPPHSAR